jgi:hypothetical protein
VYVLEGLPNGVKVGLVALVLLVFLALSLYVQYKFPRRRR